MKEGKKELNRKVKERGRKERRKEIKKNRERALTNALLSNPLEVILSGSHELTKLMHFASNEVKDKVKGLKRAVLNPQIIIHNCQ